MSRRLVLFGLLAASQLSSGCWCVRERIAWRWHNHPGVGVGCGPVCAPACNATPAFRIPSPVVGLPVGAPGCSTCTTGAEHGPGGYGGPVGFGGPVGYAMPVGHGPIGAPPIIGTPMPLGAPRVETPMSNGAPKN